MTQTTTNNSDLLKHFLIDLADAIWRDKNIERGDSIDAEVKFDISQMDCIPTFYSGSMAVFTERNEHDDEFRYPNVNIKLKSVIGDSAVYEVTEG